MWLTKSRKASRSTSIGSPSRATRKPGQGDQKAPGHDRGDLYNSDKMKSSFERLNRLRFFEEVNFQTEKGPQESLTNININVKEKPTGMFSVGAGYSGNEGAMIMGPGIPE